MRSAQGMANVEDEQTSGPVKGAAGTLDRAERGDVGHGEVLADQPVVVAQPRFQPAVKTHDGLAASFHQRRDGGGRDPLEVLPVCSTGGIRAGEERTVHPRLVELGAVQRSRVLDRRAAWPERPAAAGRGVFQRRGQPALGAAGDVHGPRRAPRAAFNRACSCAGRCLRFAAPASAGSSIASSNRCRRAAWAGGTVLAA